MLCADLMLTTERTPAHIHSSRELLRIEGRVHFGVIVKINKNVPSRFFLPARSNQSGVVWLATFPPKLEASGPPIERTPAVAAGVKLCVPMQAAVNEITGEILRIGPLACGIGEDKCDIEFAQEFKKFSDQKTGMTDFDTITQGSFPLDLEPGARFQL